jgi:hypothetical protein
MESEQSLESTQVGVAGEYFVAAELSIRGFLASITLRNSRGIDIIVSSPDASRSVSIQVKTSNRGGPKWILNKKAESYIGENHYYVFVVLRGFSQRPDFYVVPSEVVAEYTSTSHRRWLEGRKADGSARKDSAIRNFRDPDGQYREAWHLLRL